MDLDLLSRLVTLCLFAAIGWLVSRRMRLPVPAATWVLLAVGVVVGMYIRFWLLSAWGLTILANWTIAACCAGMLAGLTVRTIAQRRLEPRTP